MEENIDKFNMRIKNLNFNITTDHNFLNEQNAITPGLSRKIERYYQMAISGKKSSVPKLLEAIKNYPNSPQLKNYLSVLYGQLNETQKMYDVNKWILAEHPDYLFGKLNLANEYYLKQEFDAMRDVLGHEMDLKSLYPHRKTFHLNEVTSFLKSTILYYISIENIEEAEIRLDLMKQLAPNALDTKSMMHRIILARMEAAEKRYEEAQKSKISVTIGSQQISTASEHPMFFHQEMNELYSIGLNIEREKLKTILDLPRETLIQDLELVLSDSINRYTYFQNIVNENGWNKETMNFVIHAISILGELKASKSINSLFNVLSQSYEYFELYLDDFAIIELWEPFYKIAANNLQLCKEFLFRPGINTHARSAISDMVQQIALQNPERFDEVINWYDDVIQFFLSSDLQDNVIDSDLVALIICNLIDIKGKKLLPAIEKMFEKGIVSTEICGSLVEVNETFSRSVKFDKRKEMRSIFDRYDRITASWAEYNEAESAPEIDFSDNFNESAKPIRVGRKIGRNEPCPCGSGKKYKKCCRN